MTWNRSSKYLDNYNLRKWTLLLQTIFYLNGLFSSEWKSWPIYDTKKHLIFSVKFAKLSWPYFADRNNANLLIVIFVNVSCIKTYHFRSYYKMYYFRYASFDWRQLFDESFVIIWLSTRNIKLVGYDIRNLGTHN